MTLPVVRSPFSETRATDNGERRTMSKILIIDDEQSIRTTLAKILEDEGHRATLCESGEEGLAQFAREEFDLVLLDLWLPGMDGMVVLERLRNAGAPPVIVISGHGTIDAAVRAHGGEATATVGHYGDLEPAEREALLAFLAAL